MESIPNTAKMSKKNRLDRLWSLWKTYYYYCSKGISNKMTHNDVLLYSYIKESFKFH